MHYCITSNLLYNATIDNNSNEGSSNKYGYHVC